jgi:hypothetical protein
LGPVPPAPAPKRPANLVCVGLDPIGVCICACGFFFLEKRLRAFFAALLRAFATRRAALLTRPAPDLGNKVLPGAEDITTVTQEKKSCPVQV